MLQGADSLAHRLYSMPVNIGIPHRISPEGLAKEVSSPVYATAVGLALYAVDHEDEFVDRSDILDAGNDNEEVTTQEQQPAGEGFMTKLKDWFEKL